MSTTENISPFKPVDLVLIFGSVFITLLLIGLLILLAIVIFKRVWRARELKAHQKRAAQFKASEDSGFLVRFQENKDTFIQFKCIKRNVR